MCTRVSVFFCLISFLLGASSEHPAKKQLKVFTEYLKGFRGVEEGKKKISKKEIEKNRVNSRKAIAIIDIQTISKRALGAGRWKKMGKAKQKGFLDTLKRLVVLNSFPRSGRFLNKVKYKFSSSKVVKGVSTIRQTVSIEGDEENPEETEMLIDYSFEKLGKTWKMTNVAFDEVSLVDTYSNQFANIINKKGYAGLFDLMNKKRKDLEEEYGTNFPE